MKALRYTLLSDGSSDRALIPVLTWLLKKHGVLRPIHANWADLGRIPKPPKKLAERIIAGLEWYPCDLLFIHRDAEKESLAKRTQEVRKGIAQVKQWSLDQSVCVVPVRMTEAWLLLDESAIRRAAGDPSGVVDLNLPSVADVEGLSNPKERLHQAIKYASGFNRRRLKSINFNKARQNITEYMNDFSPLCQLTAFIALQQAVKDVVLKNNWAGPGT